MGKSWAWWHMPVISAIAGSINRKILVQASLGKKQDPISKITREKRARGIAHIVDRVPA
jgi:hypothetical protein